LSGYRFDGIDTVSWNKRGTALRAEAAEGNRNPRRLLDNLQNPLHSVLPMALEKAVKLITSASNRDKNRGNKNRCSFMMISLPDDFLVI